MVWLLNLSFTLDPCNQLCKYTCHSRDHKNRAYTDTSPDICYHRNLNCTASHRMYLGNLGDTNKHRSRGHTWHCFDNYKSVDICYHSDRDCKRHDTVALANQANNCSPQSRGHRLHHLDRYKQGYICCHSNLVGMVGHMFYLATQVSKNRTHCVCHM